MKFYNEIASYFQAGLSLGSAYTLYGKNARFRKEILRIYLNISEI